MSVSTTDSTARLQRGMSLIEMMIGMVIGLIMLSAVGTYFVNNLKANRDAVNAAKLDQDLRAAMDLMVRELRRANYTPNMQAQVINNGSAATLLANTVTLDDCTTTCSQINYSYNSTPKVIDLSGNTVRLTTGTGSPQPLTDDLITKVTNLAFCFVDTNANTTNADDICSSTLPSSYSVAVPGATETIRLNLVKISITGELINDSAVNKRLVGTVKVRNDAFE